MSNDAENEYFCDGLAEELLNALAKIDDLNVAARTSAFSFKGKGANVSEIGNALNVNTILEGSVRKSGNRLRITVQLVKASNGYHLWSERYDREMRDIFDVQDEITLAVVGALKVKLFGEERAAVLKRYTDNPQAYEFYLKGIYYRWKLTPEEFGKSLKYFEQATAADPNFALAYFGLASYYGYGTAWGLLPTPPEEGWAKAEAAMEKVLELDATLPEVLIGNAFKLVHYREWDEAGTGIERAAEANPKFPEIHHLYSFYLLAVGRFDDAVSEAKRALELDPLSLNYSRFLGICFFFARRHDEAIGQLNQALELEPNNPSVYEILGGVYVQKGMFAEAAAAWQRAMTLEGDDELAAVLDRDKDNFANAAQAIAQKRIERMNAKTASGEFVLAINLARAYLMLGDEDQTFYWLEKAVDERNVFPLLMNSDPFYDRVRSDSRFQDLLRRVGFPTDENAPGRTTNEASETQTARLSPAATEAKEFGVPPSGGNLNNQSTSSAGEKQPPEGGTPNFTSNIKRGYLITLVVFLLAAVGFGYWFLSAKKSDSSAGGKKSLAVLPFVNASQDANAEYLSDGITESIINNLSQLAGLKVMSRNSAFRFKNNQTDTKNIASQLGVESLVTGDIKQLGDKLIINVRLIDPSDDSQIWGNQYVKTTADVIAAQTEIAQAVAQNLRLRLTNSEQRQLGKSYTKNAEAYELYLRGRFHYFKITQAEIRKSIEFYEQAIELDPTYALAYAGIADAYRTLPIAYGTSSKESFPQAKAAAIKALEIDANLAEAHIVLGWIAFWFEWDWQAAESELKRAIELAPNNADAHRAYAHLLSNTGRHVEAIAESKLARELDPLSLITNSLEGQFLFYAGRELEAFARYHKTLEIEPNFWVAHNGLARIYIRQKRFAEAVTALNKAIELSGGSTEPITQLGYALAKSGNREKAQATLEELKSLAAESYVPAYNFAMVYNGLGEKEEALKYLEKSFEEREVQITFIKIDTRWDEFRAAPRFIEIIKRMNFE
ncbi:MAG: tetratricopeptide repeat protein [Acidobacteria bacterium]|jgi:TolB-like protein/Flp pilus assembly protein TadD|nr:tetratricopeptide repeat protein [Acidobacteriota bacterium]